VKPYSIEKLVDLARKLAKDKDPEPVMLPHRTWVLAHQARRMLENAAETASRNRWSVFEAPTGPAPESPVAQFATACSVAAITYPVHGEAKVYAAILDAVDAATAVAERLYQDALDYSRARGDEEIAS